MKTTKLGLLLSLVSLVFSLSLVTAHQYYFKTEDCQVQSGLVLTGATITVPDDYLTIQEAINAAGDGDTVFVRNGTYYENVIVNKTVAVVGDDRETTIVDGGSISSVFILTKNETYLTGFTICNGSVNGVFLSNVFNSEIFDNNIVNNEYGLYLGSSENNSIYENNIDHNECGIHGGHNSNNFIHANNVTNSEHYGIYQGYSSHTTISHNNIDNNTLNGIELDICSNCTIEGNLIVNNGMGIYLFDSANNSIRENTIINSTSYGIKLKHVTSPTYNNSFYHNNLVDNSLSIFIETPGEVNYWDDDCEGNYWSDYSGTDLNSDGIGGTPYIIDSNNIDHYPLMTHHWNLADINHDSFVDIYDVVTISTAYGSTPSDYNWNCHCDINEPFGVIDIYDVVFLVMSYGEEYVT